MNSHVCDTTWTWITPKSSCRASSMAAATSGAVAPGFSSRWSTTTRRTPRCRHRSASAGTTRLRTASRSDALSAPPVRSTTSSRYPSSCVMTHWSISLRTGFSTFCGQSKMSRW